MITQSTVFFHLCSLKLSVSNWLLNPLRGQRNNGCCSVQQTTEQVAYKACSLFLASLRHLHQLQIWTTPSLTDVQILVDPNKVRGSGFGNLTGSLLFHSQLPLEASPILTLRLNLLLIEMFLHIILATWLRSRHNMLICILHPVVTCYIVSGYINLRPKAGFRLSDFQSQLIDQCYAHIPGLAVLYSLVLKVPHLSAIPHWISASSLLGIIFCMCCWSISTR